MRDVADAGRTLRAALAYAELGQPVFPCRSAGERAKAPLVDHWRTDATTDRRTIEGWWEVLPDAAIGIPTGLGCGLWSVLDVDVKHGDGFVALRRLAAVGLLSGCVGVVRTPTGGKHYYFRASTHGNGSLGTFHIDHRGVGGYVLAVPSLIGGVGRYERAGDSVDPAKAGLLDWAACRALLQPPRPKSPILKKSDIRGLAATVANAKPGERNSALYWAARRAVESGLDAAPLVAAALRAGLSRDEAARTVASAVGGGRA